MTVVEQLPVQSWPTEAPAADFNNVEQVFRPTFTFASQTIKVRALTEQQILSYTALLNDYAWWVMLQLAARRGYQAAGFKTMREVMDATQADRDVIEGPWVKEMMPKLFDTKRLAGYVARYHKADPKLLDASLEDSVESWENYFHAGLPYIAIALTDLKLVQGPAAVLRKTRLDEVRKAMQWDIKASQGQRELAAELGV